jgi:uncharacterized membrane protein
VEKMMKRIDWKTLILTSLVVCAPIILYVVFWAKLPQEIPIHWGLKGEVNGWTHKGLGVLVQPLIMLAAQVLAVVSVDLAYSSTNGGKKASVKALYIMKWMLPIINMAVEVPIILNALGYSVSMSRVSVVILGFMLMIIGNYTPKMANLHDGEAMGANQFKMMRLFSYAFVVLGLVLTFSGFFAPTIALVLGIVALLVVVIVATVGFVRAAKKDDPSGRNLFSDKNDDRVFIPRKIGVGWSVNLATPQGKVFMIALVAVIVVGIIAAIILQMGV